MSVNLPLEKMSIEEKLQAMEALWEHLCKSADSVPSPPWHGEVLEQLEEDIQRGVEQFDDWEAAKRNIRNHIS